MFVFVSFVCDSDMMAKKTDVNLNILFMPPTIVKCWHLNKNPDH